MLGFRLYFFPFQHEALFYTHKVIAATGKPAQFYNNAARTGFDLSIERMILLAENPLIISLKEVGDPGKIRQLRSVIDKPVSYFIRGRNCQAA